MVTAGALWPCRCALSVMTSHSIRPYNGQSNTPRRRGSSTMTCVSNTISAGIILSKCDIDHMCVYNNVPLRTRPLLDILLLSRVQHSRTCGRIIVKHYCKAAELLPLVVNNIVYESLWIIFTQLMSRTKNQNVAVRNKSAGPPPVRLWWRQHDGRFIHFISFIHSFICFFNNATDNTQWTYNK